MNAQCVLRLASELELHPWAVHVKAIPTATVPVVKMLANPSKLPGLAGNWGNLLMHQHVAVQAGITVAGTQLPPIYHQSKVLVYLPNLISFLRIK